MTTYSRLRFTVYASFIVLIGFALRLWHLGNASLWVDEAWTSEWSSRSLTSMWETTVFRLGAIELPLYITAIQLFPTDNELLLRYPSILLSVASIPVFITLIRRIYGDHTQALWGGLLLAVNPLSVWLGRSARPYALLFFFALLVSYFFLRVLQEPSNRRVWMGFVLSSFIAYITHYYLLFLPVVQYFVLGLYLKRYNRIFRRWLIAQVVAGSGLLLVWIVQFILNNPLPAGIAWIPDPTPMDIPLTWSNMLAGYTQPSEWYAIPGLIAAVIGFVIGIVRVLRNRERQPANHYWLILVIVPLVTGLIVSKLLVPIYVDRYFTEIQPAALILMLGGWWAIKHPLWRNGLAMLVVFSSVFSIAHDFRTDTYEREDWRSVAHYIDERREPGDILLLEASFVQLAFVHYFDIPEVPQYGLSDAQNLPEEAEGRVWVIYRNPNEDTHRQGIMPNFDPFDPDLAPMGAWLAKHQNQIIDQASFNGVKVFLVDLEPTDP